MALHVALLEPATAATVGALVKVTASAGASLHTVGELPFAHDDTALRKAGPADWSTADWWPHQLWRDFRDAMARERCIYFSLDAERDPAEAPFRANSVLVIGTEQGILPDRIRDKYPTRLYRLPTPPRKRKFDLAASTALLLETAAARLAAQAAEANGL
ncbi:MAG TPA: TrmH family RNA methyltransferase, partial [Gemmatimonadales bacterium]|nr:TrmH family RNA methyltransferase [Gemmatimonadales bacterium]